MNVSVHLDGTTTTQTFEAGTILIGSDIRCIVRVLRLKPVHATLVVTDQHWTVEVDGEVHDRPARLRLHGVMIDFTPGA